MKSELTTLDFNLVSLFRLNLCCFKINIKYLTNVKIKLSFITLFNIIALNSFSQIYSSSLDIVPSNWKGNVFKLSYEYPKKPVVEKKYPWLNYNFKTQHIEYMNAVLQYFIEGNEEAGWIVQNNKIRKWYHAPSMSWQSEKRPYGREFIHGLTKERSSLPGELYSNQIDSVQNWAIGFYNPTGAYIFNKVYADTTKLEVQNIIFPEGTVSVKLLFTAANPNQVPYLKGSLEWLANIHTSVSGTSIRHPKVVRLLQVDIAVKDSRANDVTGWVFGTFAYNSKVKGKTFWERLVPVGLMWGNDPNKLNGENLLETWINPEYKKLFRFPNGKAMHLGYKGRLNGPVDNPMSSCLSCHSTAQTPQVSLIPKNASEISKYFRNLPSGIPFDGLLTSVSFDYSLQLSGGVAAAIAKRQELIALKFHQESMLNTDYFITSAEDIERTNKYRSIKNTSKSSKNWVYLILVVVIILIIFAFYKLFKRTL